MSKKIKLFSTNRSFGTVEQTTTTEENRTIDLVWTTGAKGLRSTRDGFQYYEELAVSQNAIDSTRMVGNPLLASHDSANLDSVIGVIESVTIDPVKKEGRAQVRFAKDEYSERVFQKVKDKIIKNVSVGYRIDDFKDVTQKGDDIPTYRAEKWTPFEISLVSIGFDKNAQIRSDDPVTELEINETAEANKSDEANKNNEELLAQRGIQMTEAEKQALELAAKKQAALEEKTRQNEIRTAVRGAKLEESFADELINQDVTADQARKQVIEKLAAQPKPEIKSGTATIEVGDTNQTKRREGLVDSLLYRIDPRTFKMTEGAKAFQGKGLLRQFEEILPRYTMESDVQYAKRAMSSPDLPLALANVAEKGLQSVYNLQPRTYEQWSKSRTLRNYKEYSQVKSGDFASLVERPEGDNFSESSFGEANEVAQLKDYGIKHAFTSQMLINDDMSVIERLASSSGIAVSRLENRLAYLALTTNKVMKDTLALYENTVHKNLGTNGAIGETTVAEAYKLMRKQTSTDSTDPLNLTPKYLVCGPDKEVEARKFLATIIPNQTSNVNIFQGSLQLIVDAQITGNQFYFLADPSVIDTVVCFRLEGQEQPSVDSRINFDNHSLELTVAHAFAAAPMDWRGIVKNAGS
jgi:phage head maturation protease